MDELGLEEEVREEKRDFYFRNANGNKYIIASMVTREDGEAAMRKFLRARPHFKWYYTRVNYYDGYIEFDVGSHTEFFYWGNPDKDEDDD